MSACLFNKVYLKKTTTLMCADVGEGKGGCTKKVGVGGRKNIAGIPDMSCSGRPTRVRPLTLLAAPFPSPPVPAAWRANSRGDAFVAHFQIHQK